MSNLLVLFVALIILGLVFKFIRKLFKLFLIIIVLLVAFYYFRM